MWPLCAVNVHRLADDTVYVAEPNNAVSPESIAVATVVDTALLPVQAVASASLAPYAYLRHLKVLDVSGSSWYTKDDFPVYVPATVSSSAKTPVTPVTSAAPTIFR